MSEVAVKVSPKPPREDHQVFVKQVRKVEVNRCLPTFLLSRVPGCLQTTTTTTTATTTTSTTTTTTSHDDR
ncbi:hypothetical protein E2C01_058805 [Portunus trituberculatus]|uniref:Uncharacterized protein n=1 Tax=Portunus trituberculatus TaxID=210409 RepID=A0A5B7H565_PORTR|nr:hypothetical protein [Portunus trituberculatus]